ncbi:MAG: hypothetical protein KTR16_05480 [Acidiferrobacterales bacterium]|nr:hypothetical protein [Acidiferrobacterales bacterium]
MSRIIMALVSADEGYLSKTFDHTRVDQNTVKLTPSNRHLQRAIESISLTENSIDNITFEMLDKNQQITTINSIVAATYAEDSAADSREICTDIDELSELECGLLSAAAN